MKNHTKLKFPVATLLLTAILFLTACGVQSQPESASAMQQEPPETGAAVVEQIPAPTPERVLTEINPITVEELRNATYSGIFDEPIILSDGKFEKSFEGQPFTVEYIGGTELFADLDGDGVEDAIVFLIERGGGTAAFTYIAAQLNQNGQPVDAGAAMVEDRTQVRSAVIEDGQVVLDITTRGPGDGDCCPSHKTRKVYSLEAGRLVEVPGEDQELVKISADDLNGTSWAFIEMDDGNPVEADSDLTIRFQDNQLSGSGGCNSYTSSFSLGETNPFIITIGPIAASKNACPDPLLSQENDYFAALEGATLWGYRYGQLVLAYPDEDGGLKRLRFASKKGQ